MDKSQDKTVVLTPQSGAGENPRLGNALPIGYVLQGTYVIEAQLGAGGFGITYLAKHRYLEDMWVAIKEYLPEGAAVRDESSRVHPISERHGKVYSWGLHRFLDEARLLRQFQHPNIVSVENFFEANDTAYMVMNFVRGRSIQAELDSGRHFSEDELRYIIYQLMDALNTIHRHGLYHRDISPDNILLREEDGSPVLIDFGSARYEMRMHGAEQSSDEQAHTPTTIFKQGYSPIEQYEGTTQGPYTDIYAFAATLYRIAFGTRPVDALKRSGEMRLTQSDPLVTAVEQGKGTFSEDFLTTIDVALQLDPAARPQTVDEWLENLHEPDAPHAGGRRAGGDTRRRPWAAALLALLVIFVIAGGGYYWYVQREPAEPLPTDIASLLARATAEIEADPFGTDRQDNARQLYLQALNLDGFNTRALAGLSAANLLQEFARAVKQENRDDAVVLLDEVEGEFKRAGVNIDALEAGWKRLELLNRLNTLRTTLPAAPLSEKTWAVVEELIGDMRPLPEGAQVAETTERALQALKAAHHSATREQFDDARTNVGQAEQLVSDLGIPSLEHAYAAIAEQQQAFEAARRGQIEAQLEKAEQALMSDPLQRNAIELAIEAYDQVLRLDDSHSRAQAKRTFSAKLLSAYDHIEEKRFDEARSMLLSAIKVASNAGFPTLPAKRADAFLTASERDWNLSQIRGRANELLTAGTRLLSEAPMDIENSKRAEATFGQALELCGSNEALTAERLTAENGQRLAAAMREIAQSLEESQFAVARTNLSTPQVAEWARGTGLGPPLVTAAIRTVDDREVAWRAEQATALLHGKRPLAASTLDQAQAHVQRMLELAPQHAQAQRLAAGIGLLKDMQLARQDKDFAVAGDILSQALGELDAAGVDTSGLSQTADLIERQAETLDRQRREQRIAELLQKTFTILAEQPLDGEAHATAARAFNAIAEIDGGSELAAAGQNVLALLRDAQGAIDDNDFNRATQAVDEAERALAELSGRRLDTARDILASRQTAWEDAQAADRKRLLENVAAVLNEDELDSAGLGRVEAFYQEISGLHQGGEVSESGLQLVRLLEQSLRALADDDFAAFEAQLKAARQQLHGAGLQASALDQLNAQGAARRERWNKAQLVVEIDALLESVMAEINADPLDDGVLQRATERFSTAMQLNEGLGEEQSRSGQITAGLETVFMLRAFAAELSDKQFDALKQTIAQLRERLPESRLNGPLLADLQRAALSVEVDWHIEQAGELLAGQSWLQSRDIAPLLAHIDQAGDIAPEDARIQQWKEGLRILDSITQADSRRRYDEALDLLAQASSVFAQLGVDTKSLTMLGTQITEQRDRWTSLSAEREIITWTGAAIAAMNAAPFAEETWRDVDGLLKRILTARPSDERGITLQRALTSLRNAATALQSNELAQADAQLQEARQALTAIGLTTPLQRAFELLQEKRLRQYVGRTESATTLLGQRPITDENLVRALAELQAASRLDPDNPVTAGSAEILQYIQRARAAIQATRYADASRQLNNAQQQLAGLPPDDSPLPTLRELLQETLQLVTHSRPSPGEIYPMISVGLRKIADAPLDAENLEAAELLLRNALGLQADEESALKGLRAVEQLRLVNSAIETGNVDRARAQLLQAQQSLVDIGLRESTLHTAWQRIESMAR